MSNSTPTIASLPRITPTRLRTLLLSPTPPTIIDVRDSDHIGGHIRGSQHVPSSTLDTATPELVRTLAAAPVVVFHCALSQQRGPGAALRYLRERERMLGGDAAGAGQQRVVVLEGGFQAWQEA